MATEVVTHRWCDMCLAADVTEPGAEVQFMAFDGRDYMADLCEAHSKVLREALEPFMAVSRVEGPRRPIRTSEGHPCPLCGHVVGTASGLRSHMHYKHPSYVAGQPAPHACPDCDRAFPTPQGLGAHRWREHGTAGTSRNATTT